MLTRAEQFNKIMGCWLGKAVGGTLGQQFEGLAGPLSASFYHPVPTEMVPNDDLDLQVLFAVKMRDMESPRVDRNDLAEAWMEHVEFPWNEYGVGQRNYHEGIRPPLTGSIDNWFTCGEGAAIRSELWACLAQGNADLAAAYAYEDACFDHAGDGIVAAQFLARLQTLAFYESDPDTLLDAALAGIPVESGIANVVRDTRDWVSKGGSWQEIRKNILEKYGNSDFTDVRVNTGFVILGWLAGSDFSERILICNNCGSDTDSSTASLGALLGIIDPSSIGDEWLQPIGTDLVLNDEIVGIDAPATLDDFTELVLNLMEALPSDFSEPADFNEEDVSSAITVKIAHYDPTFDSWPLRDMDEMPPPGVPLREFKLDFAEDELPGTWARVSQDSFQTRTMFVTYTMNTHGEESIRLMCNSSVDYRVWIDGEYLWGAKGSNALFPAPHSPLVGHYMDVSQFPSGDHELTIAFRKPTESEAEWVVAVANAQSKMWVPNALRNN